MVKIQGRIISRNFYLNINFQTFCTDRLVRKFLRHQDNKFHKTNIIKNLKENNNKKFRKKNLFRKLMKSLPKKKNLFFREITLDFCLKISSAWFIM